MKMHAVKSSMIESAGHEGTDLHVIYKGGKRYIHRGVTPAMFAALMLSNSKGDFINRHIRTQHPGVPAK